MSLQRIIRTSDPTIEPISLARAKEQLRVEHSIDDNLVESYISAARDRVEQYCNQYFTSANFKLVYVGLVGSESVTLPFPVAAVSTTGLTFDEDLNEVTTDTEWTTTKDLVEVVTADYLPKSIEQSMLLYLADYYDNRMAQQDIQLHENKAAMSLMNPYRINIGF